MTDNLTDAPDYPQVPRIAVGAVVIHNNHALLVKRANAPSKGRWAVPGGKVRLGETLQEAAQREVFEETGILVKASEPILTFDLIERSQDGKILFHYVIIDLSAVYVSGELRPGDDALKAVWAHASDLERYNLSAATIKLFQFQ
ncbi:MAG: NUDIX hydrolase [Desulfonatronovibrio sp.]